MGRGVGGMGRGVRRGGLSRKTEEGKRALSE